MLRSINKNNFPSVVRSAITIASYPFPKIFLRSPYIKTIQCYAYNTIQQEALVKDLCIFPNSDLYISSVIEMYDENSFSCVLNRLFTNLEKIFQ